jgi:hypothetical protein
MIRAGSRTIMNLTQTKRGLYIQDGIEEEIPFN